MAGDNEAKGIDMKLLEDLLETQSDKVQEHLDTIEKAGDDNISVGSMFKMQRLMNTLSQMSETATSVQSASHQAINSMASKIAR